VDLESQLEALNTALLTPLRLWDENDIVSRHSDSIWKTSPENIAAAKKESAGRFFNGPVVRMTSLKTEDNQIHLETESTYFFDQLGADNLKGPFGEKELQQIQKDPGSGPNSNSIGTHVVLLTADNKLPVVFRSSSNTYSSLWSLGVAETSHPDLDRKGPGISLFETAYRGIYEEMGVERSQVESLNMLAIIYSIKVAGINAAFIAKTSLTAKELSLAHKTAPDYKESLHLEFIDLADEEMLNPSDWISSSLATICLTKSSINEQQEGK
jgi:hypothetical protein